MKKLIVNADDFGLHQTINDGIIKGYREGFITSASLMCGGDAFSDAVCQAKQEPGLGIGIHLTLVGGGKPLLSANQLKTLVDNNGLLPLDYVAFAQKWYGGKIKKEEIIAELKTQFECGLATGLKITHIDSHQHLHVLPGISDIVLQLCKEFGINKLRMPQEGWFWRGNYNSGIGRFVGREGLSFCSALAKIKAKQTTMIYPEHFFGMFAGGNLNEFLVAEIIKNLPDGVSEIMTHPGTDNKKMRETFKWQYHWEEELQAFLSERNKSLLEQHKVTLMNFGGL